MSNILATIRISRDKLYDYYNNGIQTGEVKREKPDDWKIAKVYKFFSEPNLIGSQLVSIVLNFSFPVKVLQLSLNSTSW